MRIRRCSILFLEPREETAFDLNVLLAGGDGLARTKRWVALAPHLGEEVEVDAAERELLGLLSPQQWMPDTAFDPTLRPALKRLLKAGLVIGSTKAHATHRARDERLRATHWHPLAATLHAFTRWSGADAVKNMQDSGTGTALSMRQVLGPPPVEAASREDDTRRIALPRATRTDFDALLARRATCRNFDASRPLPRALFAQMLERVFAAQAQVRVTDDTVVLKKNSPSGGGLHPVEAYLVVQHVDGVAPGLYHYHATDHALEAMAWPAGRPHPSPPPQAGEGANVAVPAAGAPAGKVSVAPAVTALAGSGTCAKPSVAAQPETFVAPAVPLSRPAGGEEERSRTTGPRADERQPAMPAGRTGRDVGALRNVVMEAVAQQHWFADAHVLVVLAPRFARTFWKYRAHAKAYRVIALEAGHLSQNLYLAATDAGLGAFVTGAINEVFLERAFGLDPVCEGALAVCGFGWRADEMTTTEFDPAGAVWQEA